MSACMLGYYVSWPDALRHLSVGLLIILCRRVLRWSSIGHDF